ncbi:LPXTG cell wall anchor domain-containing protein [Lactococcus lactis]
MGLLIAIASSPLSVSAQEEKNNMTQATVGFTGSLPSKEKPEVVNPQNPSTGSGNKELPKTGDKNQFLWNGLGLAYLTLLLDLFI